MINKFIKKNSELLKSFQKETCQASVLVEPLGGYQFINHCMCMQSLILHASLNLKPLFIHSEHYDGNLVKSYVHNAESILIGTKKFFLYKYFLAAICAIQLLKIFFSRNILSLKFDGIKYGDIVYDTYLNQNSVGTLNFSSLVTLKKIVKIYLNVVNYHVSIKNTIRNNNIEAVLVSHKIGIAGGVLARYASKIGLVVYSNSGISRNALCANRKFKDIKYYEHTPSLNDINNIKKLPSFDEVYAEVRDKQFKGNVSMDAKNAYNSTHVLYENREDFCKVFKANSCKKNIFVMLHAFTDHPHSHFEKMLFKDYGDWFLKTLEYAKKNAHVNWFFKRHPSDFRYPTNDINFQELFANKPSHVHFIDTKDKVDTRSLGAVADAVITCVGSAGFEMAAHFAIPCICAGDAPYSEFSFVNKARTKKEYFSILSNLDKVEKLNLQDQREAKASYMFIYHFSRAPYSFNIEPAHEDYLAPPSDFFDKVLALYESSEVKIKGQLAKYVYTVSRENFHILRNDQYVPYADYFHFPFSLLETLPPHAPDILEEGCKILEKSGVKYCLMDGTLLGLYRDGKLISHDRDIDIGVFQCNDLNNLLYNFFVAGFHIGRYSARYGQPQHIAFFKENVVFDIIFYREHGLNVYSFGEKKLYLKHDISHFKSFSSCAYKNFVYPIPSNTDIWLAKTYGEDWNFPKIEKTNDWRENDRSESLAAYKYMNDPLDLVSFSFFK